MHTKAQPPPDVIVHNVGSIWIFTTLTDRASTWFTTQTDAVAHAPYGGPTYVVEYRYAPGLVAALRTQGFVVSDTA